MKNESQGIQPGANDDEIQETNEKKSDVMPDAIFYADLDESDTEEEINMDDSICECRKELNRYKMISKIPSQTDPLEWWAENATEFPILALLACRYLAILAGSRIITKEGTQLEGHVVADLIFLKENGETIQKLANK
jgi:hypothetical protein